MIFGIFLIEPFKDPSKVYSLITGFFQSLSKSAPDACAGCVPRSRARGKGAPFAKPQRASALQVGLVNG